jgi:CDP-diacylglycerol--serine O-phosphatidyltransferase
MSMRKYGQEKIALQNSMIKLLSLADYITILNAVFGFLAILFVFTGRFPLGATFILLGLLADGLDGVVARYTGIGMLGQYLESIADALSLAIAPLLLLYTINEAVISTQLILHVLLIIVLVFILICSMIRLSSFPLFKEHRFFVGLPTSANALFLVIGSFLSVDLWFILPFLILFAVLMISPIRFPKQGFLADAVAAIVIIATIALLFLSPDIAPFLLLIGLLLYILGGPVSLYMKTKTNHPNET